MTGLEWSNWWVNGQYTCQGNGLRKCHIVGCEINELSVT